MVRIVIACLFVFSLFQQLRASDEIYTLTQDTLNKYISIAFSTGWKYHPGDNKNWSKVDFNDSSWETTDSRMMENQHPQSGWIGRGWFRFHFRIDSSLYNKSVRLILWSAGTQKIYLDGKYVTDKSDWKQIKHITFLPQKDHLLAVRYVNEDLSYFSDAGFMSGFLTGFGDQNRNSRFVIERIRSYISQQMFFTAIILAFGLLHLILFLYNKSFKENLIYSIFLFMFAASLFIDYQNNLSVNINEQILYLRLHRIIMPISTIFILLSLYSMLKVKVPKIFWLVVILFIIAVIPAFIKPVDNFIYVELVFIIMLIESFRVIIKAQIQKSKDAWIIGAGFSILFLFSSYDWLIDIGLIQQYGYFDNGYPFGTIGLLICMSIYLSKSFASSNQKIILQEKLNKEQEVERKYLEAENKRKSLELEEARKLQLSILPKSFPEIPNLEINADMRTAAEVGGDYYDYHLSSDGTITLAIGDATGHGIKAGIMVTLIKSLFDAMAHTFFIPDFFNHCTRTIKKMNLGNLYMGMTVLKIQEDRITASAAGMPPFLIYRENANSVEEIILKGMPLGAHSDFQYQQKIFKVYPGDIILLLTDGFVELFNANKEMLDYAAVKTIFCKAAQDGSPNIINTLFDAADRWLNGYQQMDDITFLVIKIK